LRVAKLDRGDVVGDLIRLKLQDRKQVGGPGSVRSAVEMTRKPKQVETSPLAEAVGLAR
jgi:hypothetical protein